MASWSARDEAFSYANGVGCWSSAGLDGGVLAFGSGFDWLLRFRAREFLA
jgi:hypothetical protein